MNNEPFDLASSVLRARAVHAARGRAPFDVLLVGGSVVDGATGEIRPADVGLVGPLIASVHPSRSRDDAVEVIDVSGRLVAPGLIDVHMHVESSMITPRRYAEAVVPAGTTTVRWDPHEIANVAGLAGVRWAIEAGRGAPLRVLVMAPSCVPSAPGLETAGAEFGPAEMAEMLSWPEIAGVAEVMDMAGVLDRSARMTGVVGAGLESGKPVTGHARGLSGADLIAFVAAGIESDHEIVSGPDLLAKLRAGLDIELRGSHPYVLPEAVRVVRELGGVPPTLALCTDDVFPATLAEGGGMAAVVREMIALGLTPAEAIGAATFNAARLIGRRDLGLVAPGRRADLIIVSDPVAVTIERVLVDGRTVAIDGRLVEPLADVEHPTPGGGVVVPPLSPEDFHLRVTGRDGPRRVRTIVAPRFPRWGERTVRVLNGRVDPPEGTAVIAVVHRHGRRPPVPALGLLEEWGDWRGAFATTMSHDSHNLTVFGRDPVDMAVAANAVIASGGGMAVAREGRVTASLALPVFGLISDAPLAEVVRAFAEVEAAASEIVDWLPPYRVFKALVGASLACNAGPHPTDLGLTDGSTGEIVPLEMD